MLQEANDELEERIKDVQKELEESTEEMNKMTEEYTKLKVYIHDFFVRSLLIASCQLGILKPGVSGFYGILTFRFLKWGSSVFA